MTHSIRSIIVPGAFIAVLFGTYACNSSADKTETTTRTTPGTQAKSASGPETRVTAPIVLTDAEQQTSKEFEKRVDDYASFRDKLEGTIPALKDKATPEQIVQHQQLLAAMIQKERKNAAPGELFTPDTVALLKRIVVATLAGKDDKAEKETVMDENPGTMPTVGVNDKYPDGVAVTSMPAELLDQLPKLPDKMEYRFLGKRLVLLDSRAAVVVDITPNILP
jgi:hypothetical protein